MVEGNQSPVISWFDDMKMKTDLSISNKATRAVAHCLTDSKSFSDNETISEM